MEVLFHFIFVLVKISILGSIYAGLILLIFKFISASKPNSWFDIVSKNKLRFWYRSGFFISVVLFIYMFTYWGNHGLGDSARVPIGHGKSLNRINGSMVYISPKNYDFESLTLNEIALTRNYLIGKVDAHSNGKETKQFAIWDLQSDEVEFVNLSSELNEILQNKNINSGLKFKDFFEHYRAYWGGWRFWLLA